MIICYEGLLGGGKSYHAVQHALAYMAAGGHIFTNIKLLEEPCRDYCVRFHSRIIKFEELYHYVPNEQVSRMHEQVIGGTSEKKTLAIFDELHLFLNARDWAQTSRDLLAWLTQTRKLYVDVIFITQHRNNVDKQFLRLVGEFYRFRDLREWVVLGGIKPRIPMFLSCQYESDGRTLVKKRFEFINKEVFKCYASEQLFNSIGATGLPPAEGVKVKVNRWQVVVWILLLSSLVAGGRYGWKWFRSRRQKKASPSPVVFSPQISPSRSLVSVPPPARVRRIAEAAEQVFSSDGSFIKALVCGTWTYSKPDAPGGWWVWDDAVSDFWRNYLLPGNY